MIETVRKQLEDSLGSFINFLKTESAKPQEISFQLANIATTLSIFSHLKKISISDTLTIERDILIFKKSLLSFELIPHRKKSIVINKADYISAPRNNSNINITQKRILGFIESGNEVLNIEIFNHFKDISKRTLKRHLSQLITGGYINRKSQGKKVYYKKPVLTINQVRGEGN